MTLGEKATLIITSYVIPTTYPSTRVYCTNDTCDAVIMHMALGKFDLPICTIYGRDGNE